MGLFIRQDDNRTELQQRLAAQLRERAKTNVAGDSPVKPTPHDDINDSNYLKDTKTTTSLAWVWAIVVVLVIAVIVWVLLKFHA